MQPVNYEIDSPPIEKENAGVFWWWQDLLSFFSFKWIFPPFG